MLQRTTAQAKISKLNKRVRVVRGGTSASKTFTIVPFLIDYAVKNPLAEISIVAETIPHLKRGALRDFLKIMDMIGMYEPENFNKSSLVYTFSNGAYIEFFSADAESKLRGARRDVLFVNECNNITWEAYYQLAIRTRRFIYLDYNPVSEFWVDTELINDSDTDFVVLTYKDNEALDLSIIKEIEKAKEKALTSTYWHNWWNVYGLGNIGNLQGVVFNNWAKCDEIPKDAEFIAYGMDWGFTSDPTTLTAVYRYDGNLYLDELIYETGLTNSDIIKKLNDLGVQRHQMIVADSAEPKSIEDIRRAGFRIEGAKKGPDSIRNSIDTLQQQKIFITARSTNFIKEAYNYRWATDSTGKNINVPEDKNNHCFIGETLITTINGLIRIDNIKVGDLVLTSNGYKKVLKTFNNGVQQVNKYTMQLDTNLVYLCSTKEHKIKTTKGWKQISKLKSGQTVYQCKDLTEKNITYTQKSVIFLKVAIDFIKLFMNQLMVKSLKVIKFTTKTITLGIIILITWNVLKSINIYQCILKSVSKIILNGLSYFIQTVLNPLKNGISQMKGLSGINNMLKISILVNLIMVKFNVLFVKMNLIKKQNYKDFAQTNVNLNLEDKAELITKKETALNVQMNLLSINIQEQGLVQLNVGDSYLANVYDFEVEDEHEYFANGILVHNCWDSVRYVALNRLKKSTFFIQ